MKYTYELHPVDKQHSVTYNYEELAQLTTLQLREICQKEKLVIGVAYKLDRSYMIQTILKYRGENLSIYIEHFVAEKFEKVSNNFKAYLTFLEMPKTVQIPTHITLYKKADITIEDHYVVDGETLFNGNVILLDEKKTVCGILNVKKVKNQSYLLCHHKFLKKSLKAGLYKNYSLGFLDDKGSKYLYQYYYQSGKLKPTKLNCFVLPIAELILEDIQATPATLVIDFGTSNSAAGAYLEAHDVTQNVKADLKKNGIVLDQMNKVKFINTLLISSEPTEIIPTVISIKDCSDIENISYYFGYEALKQARKHSYNTVASIFYSIKKWINNYQKIEEITDEKGNTAYVSRKSILKAYFENIISIAEQQHKCIYKKLHITSPVKQKKQFLEMYESILTEYEVAIETALDEGIAVLYHSISKQIEKKNFQDGEEYQALIIDCGGGTTDLISCTYYIEDNQITYKLNLTTTYTNGETNFGGNNITFRIFQYLKILFSKYYISKEILSIEEIFDRELSDVYRYVDQHGHEKTYAALEKMYEECEVLLPTRFYEHKYNPPEEFMKVKSNFYFLWNLAEKIKVDFYQKVGISQTSFHEKGLKQEKNTLKIVGEESWRLNLYLEQSGLILCTDVPNLIITKEEVNRLIKADIYQVIKKFIEPLYAQEQLHYFNFIKLTGQSCKIDIFRDALKEFIPGRIIQASRKEKTVQDYKMPCLEGAVAYQNAKKIGLIAPTIINKAPITPYKLIAYTHAGVETVMISSLEQINKSYGFISRHIATENLELILLNDEHKVLHSYILQTSIKSFRPTTYEETSEVYSNKIFQEDIDSILEDEIKIFTFAFEDKWGFYVLPLARKNKVLLIGEKNYFPFENDEWEVNFFDGRK